MKIEEKKYPFILTGSNRIQLKLLQHYWLRHRLGLLWYWMSWKWTEIILSFLRLHPGTAFWTLLLTMMATPFLLRDSCPPSYQKHVVYTNIHCFYSPPTVLHHLSVIYTTLRLWCWEGLGARGEGDDRGWDGWMASLTRWTWVSVNSGSWWGTGRPGVLRFMGSQRVGHDWATDLIWSHREEISVIFKS